MKKVIWAAENVSYMAFGKAPLVLGQVVKSDILEKMGEETRAEYFKKGYLKEVQEELAVDEHGDDEKERLALLEQARELGLKPHGKMGSDKLKAAILAKQEEMNDEPA